MGRHRGPYDAHDARVWDTGDRDLHHCAECVTTGKGKYRKREA